MHWRSIVPFSLLSLAFPTLCLAQVPAPKPVPLGEPAAGLILGVKVIDAAGASLPGIEVTARNKATGATVAGVTDADGDCSLPGLPAGTYEITVASAGFKVVRKEVTLSQGQANSVQFTFGGPVPIGEPAAGSSTPSDLFEVFPQTFADDLSAQQWLNDKARDGLRLASVVSLGNKSSLFVMQKIPSGKAPLPDVKLVIEAVRADRLAARLNQYPDKTLLGIHRLGPNSYLMVLGNAR